VAAVVSTILRIVSST